MPRSPIATIDAMTAGNVLVECLLERDVDVVFGLPGDGVKGIIEAFRTSQEKIRFIHVRHDEAAALTACGYAKFTSKLGVCVAASGPGGIHLLNGLYDANLDGAPVVASCQLIPTAIPAGASRVASGRLCVYAIAITPAGLMELVRSSISIDGGLPCVTVRSAPAIVLWRPAQRSLTLWPARSPSRQATLYIESSDSFVASAAVSIATGWSEPVPGVGIEPRRAHHVLADRVTFPRAPLQSRKVGFPDSGFDLGFPRKAFPRRVKLKRSLAYTPTHSALPRGSSLKSWLLRLAPLTMLGPPSAQSSFACHKRLLVPGWRPAPPRRALPLLLRSYELMRQTSSLLRNSCIHTYLPRSLQVAASPCWEPVLPDVISASLSQDA